MALPAVAGWRWRDFFPHDSPWQLLTQLDAAPPLSADAVLLSGPPRCGKTTLLFHAGLNAVARGGRAVYICRRAAIETSPPLLSPDRAPPGSLDRLDMRYLRDDLELCRYAAGIHLMREPPVAVIVDDLTALVDARQSGFPDRRAREHAHTKVLGLLADAARQTSERLRVAAEQAAGGAGAAAAAASAPRCRLLVSSRSGDGGEPPPLLFITHRYLPLTLSCRSRSDGGFIMSKLPGESLALPSAADARPPLHLNYTLTASALVLEHVG